MFDFSPFGFALMEESINFPNLPSGACGKQKFLLSLSLTFDIFVIIASICNLVTIQITEYYWYFSFSVIHIGTLCILFSLLCFTIHANYGLLTMHLEKFTLVVFSWFSIILTLIFFFLISIISYFDGPLYSGIGGIQSNMCTFFHIAQQFCDVAKLDFFIGIATSFLFIILYKCFQILLLRSLIFNAFTISEKHNKQQNVERSVRTNQTEKTENESDDDDVVVFERVLGRYPGQSSIKDASFA